jgi:hypothetical protein
MKKILYSALLLIALCFPFVDGALAKDLHDVVIDSTNDATPVGTSLLYEVLDPTGTPLPRKVTIATLLTVFPIGTSERGDIFYTGASGTARLAHPAASNYVLVHAGHGGDPSWSTSPSVSTLTAASANSITLGMDSAGSGPAIGSIIFHNSANTNHFSLISGSTGAALSWTLPIAAPGGNNYLVNASTAGVLSYTDPATFATAASILRPPAGAIGANTAPLKFITGTLNTTAEAGGVEFVTDMYYGTITTAAARRSFVMSPEVSTPFTLAAPGAANALLGSDGTNWTRVTSISLDDSAAQFYNVAAPTKLVRIDASGLTAGETAVIKPVGAYTLTYTLTGATGVTLPTTGTLSTLAGAETLTNKTITAPLITNPEVDGSATANWTSVPANVKNTMVHNCGMGATASTITLPTAAVGYAFVATVCQPASATAWKFLATGSETIIVDEVKGKTYAQRTAPVMGDSLTCWTGKNSGDGMAVAVTLSQGSTTTAAAHTAVTFVISGVGYAKAADAVGVALNAVTTAANDKYGAQALDIGADGTIHAISGTNIATGFTAAADARADVPAPTAGHVRMGYVTAKRANAAGFVWATDNLATTGEYTVAFTSSALLTAGYGWNCKSGKTAWTTD